MSEDEYTIDPDVFESDMVGMAPRYQEAGRQKAKVSRETLRPCPDCGIGTLRGELPTGAVVVIEPETAVYTLLWHNRDQLPRLTMGRGYPAHRCRGNHTEG